MKTVKLSGTNIQISRLIAGGNIFSGNSHQSQEMDDEMADYYTAENIKKALFRCEECGIDTVQARGDRHIFRIMREYRNEGGKLQFIAQTAPEMLSYEGNIHQIMKECKPIAIYHHGTKTDELFKAKKYSELSDRLKIIRDTGAAVGLCTHMPEVVEYADEHGWDIDYHMTCLYNLSRIERVSSSVTGKINNGEPFFEEDRYLMYKTIKATSKQCHVFKLLGAGRLCETPAQVEDAFKETFANIKDGDAVIVGMFQKHMDQIEVNAKIVKSICG
ncbi:MAG: hypothetical protein FWH24_01130 [Oscillospiraceae bacterium]|nr:hypothetical protein [Oscillospiraceae bacterium]